MEEKRKKSRRNINAVNSKFTLELMAFVFIAVYLVGYTVSSLGKPKVNVEVVSYGQIDTPREFDGIITRDEEVTLSKETGKVFFSYNENEYVKKGTAVCSVKDVATTQSLEGEISRINQNLINQTANNVPEAASNDIDRINAKIKDISDSKVPELLVGNEAELLKLKYQIQKEMDMRSTVFLTASENATSGLGVTDEKNAVQKKLESSTDVYLAQTGGVLCYNVDSLENTLTPENVNTLTLEQTKKQAVIDSPVVGDKQIAVGEPIFKIVNSNEWFISAYLDNDLVVDWEEGIPKTIYFKNDTNIKKIQMKIVKITPGEKQTYVVFSSSRYMLEFINNRNVKFCLSDDTQDGLKIPNSAIVEKTAIKVPLNYIKEVYGSMGVYMKENDKLVFKKVEILAKDDKNANVLQDFAGAKLNAEIYLPKDDKNSEPKKFQITDIVTIKGVYVANSGSAEFKQINILTSNEFYSIIEKASFYGVKSYDRIVSDSKTVTENQIIR